MERATSLNVPLMAAAEASTSIYEDDGDEPVPWGRDDDLNDYNDPMPAGADEHDEHSANQTDEHARRKVMPLWRIFAMLSFCFANGCLLCTYFLITLPIEAARIQEAGKALYLGGFIVIAGLSQLVCPVIGTCCVSSTLGRRYWCTCSHSHACTHPSC